MKKKVLVLGILGILFMSGFLFSAVRRPLLEIHTASQCTYCGQYSPQQNAFIEAKGDSISAVKYHVWSSDPFYNADQLGRKNFYGVGGVPDAFMDGYLNLYPANPNLQNSFNTAMSRPCYLEILLDGDFDPTTHSGNIFVTLILEASIGTGPFVLHCDAASKVVPFGHGYFTEFHYPTRKMYPNYNGTPITFSGTYPETLEVTIPFTLSTSWWHYDEQAIYFAVWLQTHGSPKYIHQSNQIGIGGLNAVEETPSVPVLSRNFGLGNFYPNPFIGTAFIPVDIFTAGTDVSLRIFDLSGRTIRTLAVNRPLSENTQFEWDGNDDFGSEVSSGIYRVELSSPDYTDSKLLIKIQ